MIKCATDYNMNVVVAGDFNINLINQNAEILGIMESYGLDQIVTFPTRVTSNTATIIDHIYVSDKSQVMETLVSTIAMSDHYPVSVTLSQRNWKQRKSGHTVITYRNMNRFNPEIFNQSFVRNIQCNSQNCHLDDEVKKLTDCLISFLNEQVPIQEKRVKREFQIKWMNDNILGLMKESDYLKKSGDILAYKHARNKVVLAKQNAKRQHYRKCIEMNKGDRRQLWKNIKELSGKAYTTSFIPSVKIGNTSYSSSQEIVNIFADHFVDVASKVISSKNWSNNTEYVSSDVFLDNIDKKVPKNSTFSVPHISCSDLESQLRNIAVNKATGMDGISGNLLKSVAPIISVPLANIINRSLDEGIFPSLWKAAKVVPIFKSGSKTGVNNYRPISVLSIMSKVMERHVHNHFVKYLDGHDLLTPYQSGFRKNHSCNTCLTNLTDKWLKSLNEDSLVGLLAIDLSKGFDLINYNILMKKLEMYGCSDVLLISPQ